MARRCRRVGVRAGERCSLRFPRGCCCARGGLAGVRLVLTEDEAAVLDLVGTDALLRARAHVERGEVADLRWQPQAGQAQARLCGPVPGTVTAALLFDADGGLAAIDGDCSCGDRGCAHPAALGLLVLAVARPLGAIQARDRVAVPRQARTRVANTASARPRKTTVTPRPAWEAAVDALAVAAAPEPDPEHTAT